MTSIPDGSIVLMAVFDAARPCGTDCRPALALVGATPQAIDRRGRRKFFYINRPISEEFLRLEIYDSKIEIFQNLVTFICVVLHKN